MDLIPILRARPEVSCNANRLGFALSVAQLSTLSGLSIRPLTASL